MTVSNSYNHRSAYAHILSAIADISKLLPRGVWTTFSAGSYTPYVLPWEFQPGELWPDQES